MRSPFTMRITWKSSSCWLQLIFHFGTENREVLYEKIWKHLFLSDLAGWWWSLVNQSTHSANSLFLLKDNLRKKLVRFVDLDVSVLFPLVELEEVGVFRWGESVARHCCYERFRQNLRAEIEWDEERNQGWKWVENRNDKELWYPKGKSVLLLPWSDGMVVLF